MPQPDDDALLVDMWLCASQVTTYAGSKAYEDFTDDPVLQLAIVKLLENIGEAASRVSQRVQSSSPAIPWQNMTGMRHRLVHDYRNVNLRVVWSTVINDVPKLLEALRPLLPSDHTNTDG